MAADTEGCVMKTLPPISVPTTHFLSPEASSVISFLCVLCRDLLCIYDPQSHTHSLLSPVQIVLFWNSVIHLDLFIGQFRLVINPYLS